jgi:tetratricopeptide (TPR) repeat protein
MSKKQKQQDTGMEGIESALTKTEQFIEDNQRMISIVIGVIVFAVIVYMGYNRFIKKPLEKEARSQAFMAETYFQVDSFNLALNGDGSNLGFLDIIDEYGSTKIGNLSNYYAGISYLKLGQYDDAIQYLKEFDADDQIIKPMSIGAIGDAQLELGNDKKAVESYLKAANYVDNVFISPRYLKKAGSVYEKMGQYDKALEQYKLIENKYPDSYNARNIKKYIMRTELSMEQ